MPRLDPGAAPSPWREEFDQMFRSMTVEQRRLIEIYFRLTVERRRQMVYLARLYLERQEYPSASVDAEIARVEQAIEAGEPFVVPRTQ